MRSLILSYDYELFFGERSGTVENTLIKPTNLLLDCMDYVGFKGNFFVDYLMLKYLAKEQDPQPQEDLEKIRKQLKDMVRRGHRIELHLHPHWVDAKYNGDGTWDYSEFRHYSLSTFTENEITDMFKEGADYLNKLAREVDPDYQVYAFRAGGWAVQPFDKLKKGFYEAGIKIDSSVAHGACGKNQFSWFDFRNAPSDETYCFTNDVCQRDNNGEFLEVPISSLNRWLFYRVIDKTHRMLSKRLHIITDGTHKRKDLKKENIKKNSIWCQPGSMYTLSRISPITVLICALVCRRKLLVYIDHPKDFTFSALTSIKLLAKNFKSITYCDLI